MFYVNYLSTIVRAKKKMELLSLKLQEGITVADYHARFLSMDRFAIDSFLARGSGQHCLFCDLRICLKLVMATFSCATLVVIVMRIHE